MIVDIIAGLHVSCLPFCGKKYESTQHALDVNLKMIFVALVKHS